MINWNKTIRSMLLRRTRLSKSLSIDNTGLNWWLIWKRIQLQLGVWIFFRRLIPNPTEAKQHHLLNSNASAAILFKDSKGPQSFFLFFCVCVLAFGLHYICFGKSVKLVCTKSANIILVYRWSKPCPFIHLFNNGQKSWVKLNRNWVAWGDLQPNYSYFHKRTKLSTFPCKLARCILSNFERL